MFQAVAVQAIFVLGIVNLATAALIFLTCRCIPGSRAVQKLVDGRLMKYPAYQRLYKYHCYVWWVFWPSVITHALLAITLFGVPF